MPNTLSLPKLIAHRGASIYAPENTLSALRKAAELGAQWVECDIGLSACGQAIIIHDCNLDRTTSGRGEVAKSPYAYIRQLDAGSWFAPEFQGEYVPTLDEWLSCAAALGLGLNLELKVPAAQAELVVQRLLESLERYWSAGYEKLLISSFVIENLQATFRADKNLALGFLSRTWSDDHLKPINTLNCFSVNLAQQTLNESVMEKINKHQIPVLAYTVDDKARAEFLLQIGVAAVFSNDPCLLGS